MHGSKVVLDILQHVGLVFGQLQELQRQVDRGPLADGLLEVEYVRVQEEEGGRRVGSGELRKGVFLLVFILQRVGTQDIPLGPLRTYKAGFHLGRRGAPEAEAVGQGFGRVLALPSILATELTRGQLPRALALLPLADGAGLPRQVGAEVGHCRRAVRAGGSSGIARGDAVVGPLRPQVDEKGRSGEADELLARNRETV